jgi:hypothetical protein
LQLESQRLTFDAVFSLADIVASHFQVDGYKFGNRWVIVSDKNPRHS